MSVAFVLSGGASLGAVQVGMLRALADRRIRPDLIVGTSVGALNGAFLAGRAFGPAAVDELADLWLGLRRTQVFPLEPVTGLTILPPPRPIDVPPMDVGHAAELIDRATAEAG